MLMEWKEVQLGDIATMKYGKLPPKDTKSGIIPINSGYRNIGFCDKINCRKNTIIVVARGVGGCGDVKIAKEDCYLTNLSIAVDIDKLICDPYYFYYSHALHNLSCLNSGSAQPQITIDALQKYKFTIPNLYDQYKIISILSSLDDKIAVNRRICDNLEAQAQALFKHWFVDFAPFKDGQFVESELGMIPEGWRVGRLEDTAQKVGSGGTPKASNKDYYVGDVAWFGTGEFNDSYLCDSDKHINQEAIENSSAKIFPAYTVLIAMYGATVGRLAILTKESSFNQAALGLVAKDSIKYPFIYLTLLSIRKRLISLACGAAQQNLNANTIKKFSIIIPNDEVLRDFNEIIFPIFDAIEANIKESTRLASLRDTLLPKLMSGEIKV